MKRRLSIVIMAALLIISFVVPVLAASRTLGVSEIDQNKTKWCWAACSEMIGKYYNSGSNRDQYDIVRKIKGNTNNQGGSISNVCDAIKYASVDNVTFKSKYSALSFDSCKIEIDNSDPFVIWLQGQNGSMSHVIVASGYKTGSTNYIYILDPSPNIDEQYFSYTGLVNGTTGTLGTRCYEKTVLRK
mgnify:CR=1 FL=1